MCTGLAPRTGCGARNAVERVVFDNANAPIVVIDMFGRMQNVNSTAEGLAGVARGELVGRMFWQLVPAGEAAALRSTLDAIYADGQARSASCHWVSRSGNRRQIQWAFTSLLGPDDHVASIVAVGDLAEDIAREAAIAAAADCLSQLHTFMSALEGAASVEQVAEITLEHACATLRARSGVVMCCASDDLNLEPVAAIQPMEYPCHSVSLPVPVVTAALTGEPVLLESVEDALRAGYDRRLQHLQSGDNAWAAVPLKVAGQVIGVMELSFDSARVFGQDDRALLLVVAAQCAQALQARQARGHGVRPAASVRSSDAPSWPTEPTCCAPRCCHRASGRWSNCWPTA